MYGLSKVNKKTICVVLQVLSVHFKKNNNHYSTDVKINRNVGCYYLKKRGKFTVSDIWHEI